MMFSALIKSQFVMFGLRRSNCAGHGNFFGWSFLLYRINFEAAQSPLNLLSDILGQSPLRGFADRGGRSVRGRNGSRYEARGLQGVGLERLPYIHTALLVPSL